jgi:hypothetical protein
MGEQSPTIRHSQELLVAMKHEGDKDTRDMLGLERRPFWPRLDYPLFNPIEKSRLEELV